LFCEWLFLTIPDLKSNKEALYGGLKRSILCMISPINKNNDNPRDYQNRYHERRFKYHNYHDIQIVRDTSFETDMGFESDMGFENQLKMEIIKLFYEFLGDYHFERFITKQDKCIYRCGRLAVPQ
jgi:hypothetical protein